MTMTRSKQENKRNKSWRFCSVDEFLGLAPEESAYIEMKLSLGHALKSFRMRNHLSQAQLAERVQSSQSRVAKMEGGDPSVSLDLLIKSLLAMGASRKELAKSISG